MRVEARLLRERSLDSLLLAIEQFNRPWDRGRREAVLILLDRAFELLLKAVIVHRGARIRERGATHTVGFDRCVRKCVTDSKVKCISEEQALTLQIINSLRDASQHYIVDLSEQQLYMCTQAGVTLFDTLLREAFSESLGKYLPERVLPVTTAPPRDLHTLVDRDYAEIQDLVRPGRRKRLQAQAKLRSLAVIEASLEGRLEQPDGGQMQTLIAKVRKGLSWREVFPGVASLRLDTEGTGLSVSIKLTKAEGEAVHLVKEGTPGATVVAIKRVNELSFYSMGLADLAKHAGLTAPKTRAVILHLNLQDDEEMYKVIRIGRSSHQRYSQRALESIKRALPTLDLAEVWERHRPRARARR